MTATAKTNKWEVTELAQERILILRVADGLPIAEMAISTETGDGLLNTEQAKDIAQQIVDDWNFSCDDIEAELEAKVAQLADDAAHDIRDPFTMRTESEVRELAERLNTAKAGMKL